MIDVQPYIDRLELLKANMNLWIDRWLWTSGHFVMIDIDTLAELQQPFNVEEIMEIWRNTGVLICKSN